MSKPRKITVKKLSEHKINHHSSLSLQNPYNTLSLHNQITEKPEIYSESPYAQKITKIRSTSNLKDPSFYNSTGMVSPPMNPKFGITLKQKLKLNSTFMSKMNEGIQSQVKISKKRLVNADRKSIDNQSYLLELKIDEALGQLKDKGFSNESFEKFQECFEEVIEKDKIFGPSLKKIKLAYEEWVKYKSNPNAEILRLRSEVMEFSKRLTEEIEENKRLHRKLQKFSKENAELGRTLEERESNCRTLQEHLLKITTIDLNEVPHDKTTWKVLISENKSYSELCTSLKHKVKSLKSAEKKLMKLFWTLKQKGYPVEEVYEGINSTKPRTSDRKKVEEISDCEYISTQPDKAKPRPASIPDLNMKKIEPNSFTSDEESDSVNSEYSMSN